MTATSQTLFDDWKAIRDTAGDGWALPEFDLVFVSTGRSSVDPAAVDPAAVEAEALAAAEQNRGWLRYRSAAFDGNLWSGDDREGRRGRLLWAEWAAADEATSFRLTPDPTAVGQSLLHTCAERSEDTDGFRPALGETVRMQGHSGRILVYRVCWGTRCADDSAMRRLFARLLRIEEPQE